ncbi:hypothetical protein NLG97_g10388 [Lecanicillium saksenae]|uniref:Uncharacterized protein n=1 Tax=Lecanicillium saksenae TaxID=468837 RepID=A0ACC1QG27_9HYPO|nr:hypothetical protein NLG97_g10388 [Lecanicillium saksenae]
METGEEPGRDAGKVDGPVAGVAVVEASVGGLVVVVVLGGRGRVWFIDGRDEGAVLELLGVEGRRGGVDAAEEHVLVEVDGELGVETAAGAVAVNACLDAPAGVSWGERTGVCFVMSTNCPKGRELAKPC